MTAAAWLFIGCIPVLFALVIVIRLRQALRRARRFVPPRDWPRPFDYSTLAPPRKIARPPAYRWPTEGAE